MAINFGPFTLQMFVLSLHKRAIRTTACAIQWITRCIAHIHTQGGFNALLLSTNIHD